MALHKYSSRQDGIPPLPSPGTFPLEQMCFFPYNIINPYGTGGYTWCSKHTGTDFSYVSTPDANLNVWPATYGYWQPGGWSMYSFVREVASDTYHGTYVALEHCWPGMGRTIETVYSHLGKVYAVEGSWHYFYDPIGEICTDNSAGACGATWTGPHLHFEVRCRVSDMAISAQTYNPATGADTPYTEVIYDDTVNPLLDGRIYEDCDLYCNPQSPEYNEAGRPTKIICNFPSSHD